MSIKRLQELLNEKLGENTVDLTPFRKNPQEHSMIRLDDRRRPVRIDGIAAEHLFHMENNQFEKMDRESLEEEAAANNWQDYLVMTDEELCNSGDYQEKLYQNLKALNKLGEDEEEAGLIRQISKQRFELMSNPYYDQLDPQAFDKVPTKVLEDIYEQLKIEGGAPDPTDVNDSPTSLLQYIAFAAERNACREALMHKEISRNLATDTSAQAESVAMYMDLPETPETKKEINAGIRALIGNALAQKANKDLQLPYSEENIYKYSSAEYRDAFTSHISDADIEKTRAELGDEFFKNLAANAPKNPALARLTATAEKHAETAKKLAEANAANEWFNHLVLSLDKENFDLFDPEAKDWFMPNTDVSPATVSQETKNLLFRMAKEDRLTLKHPDYHDVAIKVGAHNESVMDKPVRHELSREDRKRRAWFEDLKAQLASRGIKTPASMMQLRVRGVEDPIALDGIKASFENGIETLDRIKNLNTPALMPHNDDGTLKDPIEAGDDVLDWIYCNMPNSLDDVDQEKINELYQMASEHRLFLKSTDMTVAGFSQNMYILVTPDSKAKIARPLDELDEEKKKDPEKNDFDGLTREQLTELSALDEKHSQVEFAARNIMSVSEGRQISSAGMKDNSEYSQTLKELFHESFKTYGTVSNIGPAAQLHNDWFEDPNLARFYVKANEASLLGPTSRNEEQAELVRDYPVNSARLELLEKKLLKLTGCKSIPEVMASGLVHFDRGHDPIDMTNSMEYSMDILRRMKAGEDLIVNGKAYNFPSSALLDECVNRDAYLEQLDFLTSRADRVSGGSAKNSAFDRFEEGLRALPTKIRELNGGRYADFKATRERMEEVLAEGKLYIEQHKNRKLNTKQLERIKIINRFKDLVKDLDDKNANPGRDNDYRIAEKLVNAALIKMKKAKHLLNDSARRKLIKTTMDHPAFKKRMEKLTEEEKLNLVKSSDKNLAKTLHVDMTFKKPAQAARENAPQNHPVGPHV